MTTKRPVHLPVYHSLNRESLVGWRKKVIAARENWSRLASEYSELRLVAKAELSDCIKHERACTQIIEFIDGKRAGLGEIQGDKYGQLTYRVPIELESAFRFCLGMAT